MLVPLLAGAMLALGALSIMEVVYMCTSKVNQNRIIRWVSLASVRNKLKGIKPLKEDLTAAAASPAGGNPAQTIQTV